MTVWIIYDDLPTEFGQPYIVDDKFYVTKASAQKAMDVLRSKSNYAQYYELRKLTLGRVP